MEKKQIQILLLEDEAAHAEAIHRALESSDGDLKVHVVGSLKEFRDYVAANTPDIALVDMLLPDGNGIDLLTYPPESNAFPMLILTSHGNEKAAVAALKAGALDYVIKSPETFAETPHIIKRNLNQWALIQENKKIQETLRSSEANFHNSMENSPLGIRIVSEDGETLYTNHAFLEIYGYKSMEEFNAKPVKDRYTPESYVEFRARRDKRRSREPLPDNYEIHIVRKNGQIRHLEVMRKGILWGGKQQYQTICQDITERKQVEEALKVSEQNFRNSIDSSPMGIRIMDSVDNTVYANQALLDMFGYRNIGELNASPPQEYYTPESHADFLRRKEQYARGEPLPELLEFDIIRTDGTVRNLQLSSKNVFWDGKQQFQLIYIDITERKRTESTLRQSENKYRELTESISDVFFAMDNDLRYTHWNKASEKLTGILAADALGRRFSEIFPENEATRSLQEMYLKAIRMQQSQHFISKYPGGKNKIHEITIYPTNDGISVFTKDITERIQMEDV